MTTNLIKLTFRSFFYRSAQKEQYIQYYQSIFPSFETLQIPQAITIMENLKRIQMIDQPLWTKMESIMITNLSRITTNDLSRISKLFLDNNMILQISPRFYHIFDEKISKNINNMNIEEMLQAFMYTLKQKRKLSQIVLSKILDFKSDYDQKDQLEILKACVLLIQCRHKINYQLCQQFLSDIYEILLLNNLNLKEMILYIDIFSPKSIQNFEKKLKYNHEIIRKAQNIVTGYSFYTDEKFLDIPFIQKNDLGNIQNRILEIFKQKLGFQNLQLGLKFIQLIQDTSYQGPIYTQVFQEIIENINLLTTEELSNIFQVLKFDHEMWISYLKERNAIKEELKIFFLQNQKQFDLTQSIAVLSLTLNFDILDIKKIVIAQLLEKISLEEISLELIIKFNFIYPKLISNLKEEDEIILNLKKIQQKFNSIQDKCLQMSKFISAMQAQQIMQIYGNSVENFQQIQVICEKIQFKDHQEVGSILHYLREQHNNQKLSQCQLEQLKKIIKNKIDINVILK